MTECTASETGAAERARYPEPEDASEARVSPKPDESSIGFRNRQRRGQRTFSGEKRRKTPFQNFPAASGRKKKVTVRRSFSCECTGRAGGCAWRCFPWAFLRCRSSFETAVPGVLCSPSWVERFFRKERKNRRSLLCGRFFHSAKDGFPRHLLRQLPIFRRFADVFSVRRFRYFRKFPELFWKDGALHCFSSSVGSGGFGSLRCSWPIFP